jgi:hypothetical protein
MDLERRAGQENEWIWLEFSVAGISVYLKIDDEGEMKGSRLVSYC